MNARAEISGAISVSAVFPGITAAAGGLLEQTIPAEADLDSLLNITAAFSDPTIETDSEIINKITSSTADEYAGDYEITSFLAAPSLVSSLVLPTKRKIMSDDLTIYSVPTSEEYNSQGGVTFTIGG